MRSSSSTHVSDPLTATSTSCSSDEDLPEFSSQSDLDSLTFDPCEGSAESEGSHIFTELQEMELVKSNILSLTQKVQLNRSLLQHLLRSTPAEGQSEETGQTNTVSDLDVSDSEDQQNVNKHSELTSASPLPHPLPLSRACACVRPFVSARLPRQQQCVDGARMKRRPEPLRADHNLLAPDTRCLPGVRYCAVSQVNSLPGHLNNYPRTQTAGRSSRRRPESSPNRRLRFEDETEKEAESRYLERQKRRAGQRAQDILVSKPDVSQYVNGRHKALSDTGQLGVNLRLHPTPPVYKQRQILYPIPPARPVISLRTEPIKETYIGVVTYSDSDGGETEEQVGQRRVSNMGGRRTTNHMKQNGLHEQATPRSDLPVNPYAPEQTVIPLHSVSAPSSAKVYSSPIFLPSPPASLPATSHNGKHNDTRTDRKHKKSKAKDQKCQNADPTEDHSERASEEEPLPSELRTQGGLTAGESSLEDNYIASSSSAGGHQILTASNSNENKRSKQPTKTEHQSPLEPVEGSRLSLRRLFSSVRLGRSRSSSLDRTSSGPCSPEPPSGQTKPYGLLKKTPSVQSLTMGSPFLKLRKSASVQNFVSEQKKKDRSENYKPGSQSALQRCLSVEDVSCPSSLRSVGRILQVYTDGTMLLELSRPKSQTYGFIISRGKGRTDSGVYVEDMVDSSTEKLYAGLLAVGDEILEVNEEKVACLSLDQVTHLLSHSSAVRVRVLRQRKPPSR